MSKTTIEWTDRRWNPVRGCSRVSPGCVNCYAERIAARFSKAREGPKRQGEFQGFAIMKDSALPCLRMEIHECGLPACENHIREFDEGMSQCADHWQQDDFQKVYGVD